MTYTIKGVRETGTITYYCVGTLSALDKFRDFERAEYKNITIATSEEHFILASHLVQLASDEKAVRD